MTLGQWVGSWFGNWFGSGEEAPAGSMSGQATLTLGVTANASARGALVGQASIAMTLTGDLISGAVTPAWAEGAASISLAAQATASTVTAGNTQFWAEGFWADGFWSEGFWGDASSAVVHPPYVETEYVVSRAARLAVRTSVDAVRLLTKVDGASVLGRVQRIDLFERPKLEARRESKLCSEKAVLRQAASVLTVPRKENVATRALHTVVTTLPDDYVTWNELECMRVLDRKHVVTVKQGAEG